MSHSWDQAAGQDHSACREKYLQYKIANCMVLLSAFPSPTANYSIYVIYVGVGFGFFVLLGGEKKNKGRTNC